MQCDDKLNDVQTVKKLRKNFILSLIISTPFIILPFFDHSNVSDWVGVVSTMTNLTPSFQQSAWPGGPFFLAMFVPLGTIYIWSHFSLYFSAIFLKIVLFVFTSFTAFLIYKMNFVRDRKLAILLFTFVMINPATIYINYIWVQLDIFPTFFVLLSYYLILYTNIPERNIIFRIASYIPLMIAIFSFYFAILLIPSILFYSRSNGERLKNLIGMLFTGIIFLAIDGFLFGAFSISRISLLEHSSSSYYFEGIQSAIIIPSTFYIVLLSLLSIFIPLLTKYYKFPASASILMVLIAILYTSNIAIPDNFLWTLPFSVLAVTETALDKKQFYYILMNCSFLFIGIFFINLYIGTGSQAGIFYFGYSVFHRNILYLKTYSEYLLYVRIYFIFLSLSVILTIYSLVRTKLISGLRNFESIYLPTDYYHKNNRAGLSKLRYLHIRKLLVVSFLLILIAGSLVFNDTAYHQIKSRENQGVPLAYTFPTYSNGNYAMPMNGITYNINKSSIKFYDQSPVIHLTTNLKGGRVKMDINEFINPGNLTNISLVNTNIFSLTFMDQLYVNNSNQMVVPIKNNSLVFKTYSIPEIRKPVLVTNFTKSNQMTYNITCNLSKSRTLFYDIPCKISPASTFNQTVPFGITLGNFSLHIVLYNNSGLIVYSIGTSKYHVIPFHYAPIGYAWNLLSFYTKDNTFDLRFDNCNFSIKSNINFTSGTVYVGQQPGLGATHSFTGRVSRMYISKSLKISHRVSYIVSSESKELNITLNSTSPQISLSDMRGQTCIQINTFSTVINGNLAYMVIGKLSKGSYSLGIKFDSFTLENIDGNSYYLVPVFFATITPYLLLILSYFYFLRNKVVE